MTLLEVVVKTLDELNIKNIRILDMKGVSPLFDYMVIATATNDRQAQAATRLISDNSSENGYEIKGIEGANGNWILVDCKDVIVNIFSEEERDYYGLDNLYLDIKQIDKDVILKNINA